MLVGRQALIQAEVQDGTGAAVDVDVAAGAQSGLRLWFSDLGRPRSPIVELRPKGLKRYEARLIFGRLAGETIAQMKRAGAEELQLARALIKSMADQAEIAVAGQDLDQWTITDGGFTITAEVKGVDDRFGDEALTLTCRALVIPMLAAMAELYGYDPVAEPDDEITPLMEGAISWSTVRRRERNPRNRLLALRIHGSACGVCRTDPTGTYGDAGSIIEVHHIQPLSSAEGARPYDPQTDLIPLCPNCHRAVHTRRPIPWSPDELRAMLAAA